MCGGFSVERKRCHYRGKGICSGVSRSKDDAGKKENNIIAYMYLWNVEVIDAWQVQ